MADRTVKVQLKAEIADYLSALRKAGKATTSFGDAVEKSGKGGIAALGGLDAAAAAASVGVAAALAGAGASFVALGAVALRNNTEVRQSFENLSTTINTGIAQDAAPLATAFVGAAEDIGAAYTRLRPELQDAFQASVPYVEDLTSSVIDFAENAMPGVVTAVESAGPVFDGLHSMASQAGEGVGEFFEVVSTGAESAGQGLEHFGQLAQDGLPEIGGILVNLTDIWAEHGDEVVSVVTRILGVVNDLSGTTLPVLADAVGVAVRVLDGLLDVIEPIADEIGPLIGVWLTLAAAMKGIKAVKGIFQGVALAVADFGTNMRKAGGKAKLATAGIVGGIAALGSVLISTFDEGSYVPQIEALTVGLERWAEQSRISGEAAKVLGKDAKLLGETFTLLADQTVFDEINRGLYEFLGGTSQLTVAEDRIASLDTVLANLVEGGKAQVAAAVFRKMAAMAKESGISVAELRDMLPGYAAAQEVANAKAREFGNSLAGSTPGADALREALKTLGDQTATVTDHVNALNLAWKRLHGIQITLQEAVAGWEGGLDTLRSSLQQVKKDTNNWRNALFTANGEIDLTKQAGRELMANLVAQGEDYRTLAQTVYDTTLQRTGSEQRATAAVVAAAGKRRSQFVSEMTQMGFTQSQAQDLANEYLGMPDDVITIIKAEDNASHVIGYVKGELMGLHDKTITITSRFVQVGGNFAANQALSSTYADGGMVGRYADGGSVQRFPSGGMVHGPGGPREDRVPIWASPGEFVVNARATSQFEPLLRAINSGNFAGSRRAGGVQADTINLNVSAIGRDFSLNQVMDHLALQGVA